MHKTNPATPEPRARQSADPIMEEVFQIIEARDDVEPRVLDSWLDAHECNDPAALYEAHISPAIDEIEAAIKESMAAATRTQEDER